MRDRAPRPSDGALREKQPWSSFNEFDFCLLSVAGCSLFCLDGVHASSASVLHASLLWIVTGHLEEAEKNVGANIVHWTSFLGR